MHRWWQQTSVSGQDNMGRGNKVHTGTEMLPVWSPLDRVKGISMRSREDERVVCRVVDD